MNGRCGTCSVDVDQAGMEALLLLSFASGVDLREIPLGDTSG